MAGLRQTTAKLARYRRNWEKLLAGNTAAKDFAGNSHRGTARLREITGFGGNPGNLRMLTYVPASVGENAPLVVVLHGCTQTADGYDLGAGWSTLADRYGFALLLPEQRRANNPNVCFNWFLPGDTSRGQGEALSIRQMIGHTLETEELDANRVFVTGLSAGGAMTAAMLATYPEVFAGGAIIAGLPFGAATSVQEALDCMYQGKSLTGRAWGDKVRAASTHAGPWPRVSLWHGSADATVLPVNGTELVKQWTDVHGLSAEPDMQEQVDGYPRRVWLGASGEPLVESYTITGMAHGTPIAAGTADTNCGAPGPFLLETGISSSYRIASFWGLTRRAAEPTASAIKSTAPSTEPYAPDETSPRRASKDAHRASKRPADLRHQPNPAQLANGGFDPEAVISKALRSAGLLKR